jgi:cyanophycin synthetase
MKDYLKEAGNIHLSYYLQAADELGIAYEMVIPNMTARFSYQGLSWYINNTVVAVNSSTSSRLTRDKKLANKILASQGIPVPLQIRVETVEEAITFWNEHNKAIVLKPLQNYGGKGVSILPKDENEVTQAFNDAKEHDRAGRVLAE